MAKLAVRCGAWLQFERENGTITINRRPEDFALLDQYLDSQGRFRLTDADTRKRIADELKRRYEMLQQMAEFKYI